MGKVAKLVSVSFLSRVIVDENANKDEIIRKAKENVRVRLDLEFGDNVDEISNDEECPYGFQDIDEIS